MKPLAEILLYLYSLQDRGVKFGLRNTRTLLRAVGNPHQSFPSIHIAGTNGKGSTAAFVASIFMEAGYKTGLYTSPHLVEFTERIRVNGRAIPESLLCAYVEQLRPTIERVRATFFEATTCVAFQYFAYQKVDIAVVETGLGGRLDATNVLTPLVTVIASISYDHTDKLGNTLRSIAKEKGGIIKPGVPCVTSATHPVAIQSLSRIAVKKNTTLFHARETVDVQLKRLHAGSATVGLRASRFTLPRVRLGFRGPHQIENARLAVAALDTLLQRSQSARQWKRITAAKVADGLQNVVRNSKLRGRLETFGKRGRYIFDAAHNPAGMQTLCRALSLSSVGDIVAVFGVMQDKDYIPMLDELSRVAKAVIAVAPGLPRALDPEVIVQACRDRGIHAKLGQTVKRGLQIARAMAGQSGRVLVTGSHYVVGGAMQVLHRVRA